ncbi:hypothetical protein OH76DRAFT_1031290 [Lentinus brumalis]|uniref:Uncharacterized protein n=1 Tax=Lentinus brumalis TaxID=2498619 RepID=A0A371CXD7_9APHY|nr:hypothetical protein OH76DRAFT_1031290 [Polyporus brumalis]
MDATDRLLACPHDREMAVPWPFLANPNDSIETAVQNIGISGWPGLVENFSQSQSTKGLSKAELNLLAVPVVRIQRQAVHPILDENASSILELWLKTVPERHYWLAASIGWNMTGEAGAEQWLQQIFNVLHYYYNQCRGLPGSLGVETKRSMVEEGLTITDITLLMRPGSSTTLGRSGLEVPEASSRHYRD